MTISLYSFSDEQQNGRQVETMKKNSRKDIFIDKKGKGYEQTSQAVKQIMKR
jgi:hypothetical protein